MPAACSNATRPASPERRRPTDQRGPLTTPVTDPGPHRITVGPTGEFSLFFHVRPGHEQDIRAAIDARQASPGYRPGDYALPIAVIHEARFVLFDDDTRML